MTRRRFAFWLGMGMFTLSERLRIGSLDAWAAEAMRRTEPKPAGVDASPPIHWTANENTAWRWFERESFVDGSWKLTGITTPIRKTTGEHATGTGYLDESLVPQQVRGGGSGIVENLPPELLAEYAEHQPSDRRKGRHGRPPSKWLRSLYADELRLWLRTIDVPEAEVSGMTFWEHLTRDHSFDAEKIEGLSVEEQAKLHAAAHFGY